MVRDCRDTCFLTLLFVPIVAVCLEQIPSRLLGAHMYGCHAKVITHRTAACCQRWQRTGVSISTPMLTDFERIHLL